MPKLSYQDAPQGTRPARLKIVSSRPPGEAEPKRRRPEFFVYYRPGGINLATVPGMTEREANLIAVLWLYRSRVPTRLRPYYPTLDELLKGKYFFHDSGRAQGGIEGQIWRWSNRRLAEQAMDRLVERGWARAHSGGRYEFAHAGVIMREEHDAQWEREERARRRRQ